jgi:tRNA pseudouridine13 synthase
MPCAHGEPPAAGDIRSVPEDFLVEEQLGFEADGAGGHGLLQVEKRGANTGWVAAQLAKHAAVPVRDVGFSGHKDRHAVTRQAFTLPLPAAFDVSQCLQWQGEGYRVFDARRHARKLRPGSHRANRFVLRIRNLQGAPAAIEARLETLRQRGVPNYFGPQRFGREGSNLSRVLEWAAGGPPPRDRVQRGFLLSAGRSELFNRMLAARVAAGHWDRLLPGEAVMLDGRRSFFVAAAIDETLAQRALALDVHPSGPLAGAGDSPAVDEAGALEAAVMASGNGLVELLARERLEHERRSLRLPVRELAWTLEESTLEISFVLPRGAFATAVLHELLRDAWDAGEE